jgi:hypothetical protein
VKLCVGASVAAAAAVATSTPSGCTDFQFVALFEGASLTGRAADTSTKLMVSRQQSNRVSFYIGGSGFSPEWSGVLCVLRCGDCSSFSAATFHSGVMSSCSAPPACSNASACNLSLVFPTSTFPVASVIFEVPGEDFTAYGFSVNGCTENCTALLSPFDAMLLLRFLAGGRNGPLWVQAVPDDTMVLEKPPAYPVEDVVPIRRGSSSNGRTMVRATSCRLAHATSFMSYSHVLSRSHFISANAAAAAPTLRFSLQRSSCLLRGLQSILLQVPVVMSVCVPPFVAPNPPPAVQIGSILQLPLTMHTPFAASFRVSSSHSQLAAYVVSNTKDGVVLVLEALGTGTFSVTLAFEGL